MNRSTEMIIYDFQLILAIYSHVFHNVIINYMCLESFFKFYNNKY